MSRGTNEDLDLVSMNDSGLSITSAQVADAYDKKSLSASLISDLVDKSACPARWLANSFVLKEIIDEPVDTPATRGSLFHKVMEDFFTLPGEERTSDALKDIMKTVLSSDDFRELGRIPEARQWLIDAIKNYFSMGGKPDRVKIAEVEYNNRFSKGLEMFVKGHLGDSGRDVLGFIDRISVDPRDDVSLVVEDYKGLALDTPLPTPDGWTTMGKVQVGSKILGTQGKPVCVSAKSSIHHRPCFRLSSSDGGSIIADNVHLWDVYVGDEFMSAFGEIVAEHRVVSTQELHDIIKSGETVWIASPAWGFSGTQKHRESAASLSKVSKPYLIGAWLADGNRFTGAFNVVKGSERYKQLITDLWRMGLADEKEMSSLRDNLISNSKNEVLSEADDKSLEIPVYRVLESEDDSWLTVEIDSMKAVLDSLGLLDIPSYRGSDEGCGEVVCNKSDREQAAESYLDHMGDTGEEISWLRRVPEGRRIPLGLSRGSEMDRTMLLQGILAYSTSWSKSLDSGVVTLSSRELLNDVVELLSYEGVSPYHVFHDDENSIHQIFLSAHLIETWGFMLPGKLHHEASRALKEQIAKNGRPDHFDSTVARRVVSVEPVESVPTQCIQVDSPDSLYLAGPTALPTHNTGKVKKWVKKNKSEDGLKEQRQQIIYSMLLEQQGYNVSTARLIYPVYKEIVKVDLKDEDLRKRTLHDIAEADKLMDVMRDSNMFEFNPTYLCSWCPLVKACPAARPGKGDKARRAYMQQPEIDELSKGIFF